MILAEEVICSHIHVHTGRSADFAEWQCYRVVISLLK